jgi:hypothetical protein
MKKPADLFSGARKAEKPKPAREDPFAAGEPSITAESIAGTNALGMLAAERETQNVIAYNNRVAEKKARETLEEAKWQEILARRNLHRQMA